MSAAHRGKRAKGYILDWNPQHKTEVLIGQVQEILDDLSAFLPLTARQIFYRMVGAYGYDKTEQAYERLCNALVKARRARMIPFSAIRDDGTAVHGASGWDNPAQWWQGELSAAKAYKRDRTKDQPVRIELWCEAAGMAPQLANVARPYGVPVFSTGGFSSVTVTHEIAQRVIHDEERPTVFMHVGDYDPSGESIFTAMSEDVGAFVAEEFEPEHFEPVRVALTREQVTRHNLDTAPPKRSDTRSRNWVGETCQAEAMDPRILAQYVKDAIEERYDLDVYEALLEEERAERDDIVADVREILDNRKDI